MILAFAFTVCFSILAAGGTVAYLEITKDDADTTQIVDTIGSLVAGMMGALLGLIAGKADSVNNPPPQPGTEIVTSVRSTPRRRRKAPPTPTVIE